MILPNKVAMIVYSHFPEDPRVLRQALALIESGIRVDIFCLRNETQKRNEIVEGVDVKRILSSNTRKENLYIYIYHTTLFFILSFLNLTLKFIKNRYDIIQVHNMPEHLIFSAMIPKLFGAGLLLDLHDLTPELFSIKWGKSKNKFMLPLIKFIERYSCNFSNHILTTSIGFKDNLVERGINPDKITLVYNSADENLFKLGHERSFCNNNIVQLIYHGTVAFRFGIHIAIIAMKTILNNYPNSKLLIYGKYDPDYKAYLNKLITDNHLHNNVSLGGYLPPQELTDVINNSNIALVPYLDDPFMNLALSTKTFEYAHLEIPIIASSLKSIRLIFNSSCIKYVKPGDPIEISKAVHLLAANPDLQAKMTKETKNVYKQYSWNTEKNNYLSTILDVIN